MSIDNFEIQHQSESVLNQESLGNQEDSDAEVEMHYKTESPTQSVERNSPRIRIEDESTLKGQQQDLL